MGAFLTDPGCVRQREYVNIPVWHEKGYTGKGLVIFHDDDPADPHAGACADIIQTILPDATVLTGAISYTTKNNKVEQCNVLCAETNETLLFEEFILKNKVTQINNSTSLKASNNLNSPIAVYMREMIEKYNLFCTGSAGNSEAKNNKYKGAFVMVSGVNFFNRTNEIVKYGPAWPWVDFSMFMGFQFGTSFAAPFLNGMAGLLRSKDPNMTQAEIYKYFKAHCKDLGAENNGGWGVPIMGDPKTVIKMQIGNHKAYVDGKPVILDAAPKIENQRTLVPARFIAEAFGAEVEWDPKTEGITIVR